MGLVLDEPGEEDLKEECEGIPFIVTQREASMILYGGPVSIHFVDRGYHSDFRVTVGAEPLQQC